MNDQPRVRLVLLALAIASCLFAVATFEDAGEVLSLVGGSWLAIAVAFIAGALI